MTKTCVRCGETKDQPKWHGRQCTECLHKYRRDWAKRSKDWLLEYNRQPHIRKAVAERATRWNREHPDKRRKNALAYYYRLQQQAIEAYGGYRCACCGETEPLFLTLDHVNNDGSAFRKKSGFTHHGAKFYKWLRDNGWPPGYQVLCSNCNHGKFRNNGVCPHQGA